MSNRFSKRSSLQWSDNAAIEFRTNPNSQPSRKRSIRFRLVRAFEQAEDGCTYVVHEKYRKAAVGPDGWRNVNLRTTFEQIVKRAGIHLWPRLFHNLRSSRETELLEEFPIHVVAKWMGHSVEIAAKHYAQVTEEHFERASFPKSDVKSDVACCRTERQERASQEGTAKQTRKKQSSAALCEAVRNTKTDGVGFEPTVRFHVQ